MTQESKIHSKRLKKVYQYELVFSDQSVAKLLKIQRKFTKQAAEMSMNSNDITLAERRANQIVKLIAEMSTNSNLAPL